MTRTRAKKRFLAPAHDHDGIYRAVIENSCDIFISIGPEGEILDWNRQATQTLGWRKEEVLGKPVADVVIPFRFRHMHLQGMKQFLNTGKSEILNRRIEVLALHKDGHEIPVEITITPMLIGKKQTFSAFLHDVSNRRWIEKLFNARLFVTEVLSTAQDTDEGVSRSLQAICSTLEWDYARFWRFSRSDETFKCHQTWSKIPRPPKDPVRRNSSICTEVLLRKEGLWIENIKRELQYDGDTDVGPEGDGATYKTAFAFPVMSGVELKGVIEIFCKTQQPSDHRLIGLAKDIGSHVGQFIKQREALSKVQNFYLELERRVEERTRDIRMIMNNAPIVLWSIDKNGTFTVSKGRGLEVLGLQNEQLVGKSAWQFYAGQPEIINQFKKGLAGEEFLAEAKMHGRWFETHYNPLFDGAGEVTGLVGISTDITDRKIIQIETEKASEAAERARHAAEEANQAKTNFLANMSHEIRTPLGAILGFADLMLNSEHTTQERLIWLNKINQHGDHVLQLIDEILDLSKVEAGHLELESLPVDLSSLQDDLLTLFSVRTKEKDIELVFSLDENVPSRVSADPLRLKQILMNIIGNAVKFTDRGTVKVQVKSTISKNNKVKLCFAVSDSGPGIARDQIKNLFLPFSQGDSSHSRKFGGTGLGLALSRRLARSMGGDIKLVRSTLGEGCLFEIEIETLVLDHKPATSRIRSELKEKLVVLKPTELRNCRILLVEDSLDNQLLITRFLKQPSVQIEIASDGLEAYDKAREKKYDVILMDIQMPRQDGYETTAQLRKQGYRGPIIALTAHALAEEKKRSLSVGCDDHLTKPVDRRLLLETIARYVNEPVKV